MRPLKAVILATNKKTGLQVRLESGILTTLPYDKDRHVGEIVLVKYNFVKKEVLGIVNSYSEILMPEPTKMEKGGRDNDPEDPEVLELLAY